MPEVTAERAKGWLYAKVEEFIREGTEAGEGSLNYTSFPEMEQGFKEWLWGTKVAGGT